MFRPRHFAKVVASISAVLMVFPSMGVAGAQPVDRHELSQQTQNVGRFWDQARPVLDVKNPANDQEFFIDPEGVDLSALELGTVLRERTFKFHIASFATPLDVTQLLYVTTNSLGERETNVTSVIHPPQGANGSVVSYQSFYDSTNPADKPSQIIAGNFGVGGLLPALENTFLVPALSAGRSVVIADIQGKESNFVTGPAYGAATLDSLRAVSVAKTTGITQASPIGLFGYSGGAIASNWAAIRAHEYAPEIERRLVGVAQGGLFVNPMSNLSYAGEGLFWSGVVGMAISSIAHTYSLDIDKYLNDYGRAVIADTRNLSIVESYGRYPSVRWSDLAKPEYPSPADVPELMQVIEQLNMGAWDAPRIPLFIFQGANGILEGTPDHPELGMGDGVMVTKDVRTLVRQYCAAGTSVEYREYPYLGHFSATAPWATEGYLWLEGKFRGAPATNNCQTVPEGNPL